MDYFSHRRLHPPFGRPTAISQKIGVAEGKDLAEADRLIRPELNIGIILSESQNLIGNSTIGRAVYVAG